MINFDDYKLIEDIKKNGIAANDRAANYKLKVMAQYLMNETSYSEKAIIKKMRTIAKGYYDGLSDSFVESDIVKIMEIVKEKAISISMPKTLTLYKSEMETINSIKDENTKRILFAALVCFKFLSQHEDMDSMAYYNSVQECKADIFRFADIPNVSGAKRNAILKNLTDMGLIKFFLMTNRDHRYNQTSWIAMTRFTMSFCVDIKDDKTKEEKWMDITNFEDIMLYLRYYNGDPDITICQNCGCPIVREKAKRYCSDCAREAKKESDKKRYNKVLKNSEK